LKKKIYFFIFFTFFHFLHFFAFLPNFRRFFFIIFRTVVVKFAKQKKA